MLCATAAGVSAQMHGNLLLSKAALPSSGLLIALNGPYNLTLRVKQAHKISIMSEGKCLKKMEGVTGKK